MRGKTFDREYLVSQIAKLRIKGKSTQFILEFLKDEIGMGQTTAYDILKEARTYINEITEKDFEKAYNESIQQLEEMMGQAEDIKTKLAIKQELNKLQGLYAAQKVEHSGQIGFTGIDVQIINKKEDLDSGTQSQEDLPQQ